VTQEILIALARTRICPVWFCTKARSTSPIGDQGDGDRCPRQGDQQSGATAPTKPATVAKRSRKHWRPRRGFRERWHQWRISRCGRRSQRVRLSPHFAIVKSSIEVRFSTRSHLLSNSKPRELHKAFLHRPPCYLKFEPRIYLASGLF
jgi:hypothetical protein